MVLNESGIFRGCELRAWAAPGLEIFIRAAGQESRHRWENVIPSEAVTQRNRIVDVVDVGPELQHVGTSQYRGAVETFVVIFCSFIVTKVRPAKLNQSGDLDAWTGPIGSS